MSLVNSASLPFDASRVPGLGLTGSAGSRPLSAWRERLHLMTAINPIPTLIDRRSEGTAFRLSPVGR
jgi:hypothetical protein